MPVPEGWCEIDAYHPNTTPWDVAGRRHQNELIYVLDKAGVIALPLTTHHRRISPQGTGPGGRIRFGDDMMPGIYRLIVANGDKEAADRAIAAHHEQVKAWIYEKGPMPEACRQA